MVASQIINFNFSTDYKLYHSHELHLFSYTTIQVITQYKFQVTAAKDYYFTAEKRTKTTNLKACG